MFITIYYAVWADKFGSTEKVKTMWLSLFLLTGPIGVLLGYLLCASLIEGLGWRYAFYIQSGLLLPVLINKDGIAVPLIAFVNIACINIVFLFVGVSSFMLKVLLTILTLILSL